MAANGTNGAVAVGAANGAGATNAPATGPGPMHIGTPLNMNNDPNAPKNGPGNISPSNPYGTNPDGSPITYAQNQADIFNGVAAYPGYNPTFNPSTMSDVTNLQQLGPQYDQGFNALRSQALNQGPSQWLSMSQLHNQMQLEDALNSAEQTSAGKTAAGEDALAAGGGLSSGARERMQEQGGTNLMSMDQGLQRTGMEQNVGMEATDQSNKIGQLNNLVSDENTKQNQWNQAYQSDVSNEMQNVSQQNQYNMNLYNTKMQAWGAEQQANATANSGKK